VPARPTQRPRGRRAGAIARPPARGLCAPGCSRVLLTRAAHAAGAGRQEDWAPARGGGGGGESEAGRATAPRAAKLWQRGAKLAIGRRASAGRAGGSDAARDRGDGAGGADDGRLQQPTSSVGGAPSAVRLPSAGRAPSVARASTAARVPSASGVAASGAALLARVSSFARKGSHPPGTGDETRPVSTGGGTRRVQLVREGGGGARRPRVPEQDSQGSYSSSSDDDAPVRGGGAAA